MLTAIERLDRVQEQIQRAAQRSGRTSHSITLLAVTKTFSLDQIQPFLEAGVRHVGENRVQEAASKYADASGNKQIPTNPELHLIGHLQSNKVKKAVTLFDSIDSLDSEALAAELNRHAQALGKTLPCLVQVKISEEPNKTGLPLPELPSFIQKTPEWTSLKIHGLMGIAPYVENPEEARPYFAALRKEYERYSFDTLSMGMSHDFEVAVEEGATLVRVGTALFGERNG